jgi:hypothetical protein
VAKGNGNGKGAYVGTIAIIVAVTVPIWQSQHQDGKNISDVAEAIKRIEGPEGLWVLKEKVKSHDEKMAALEKRNEVLHDQDRALTTRMNDHKEWVSRELSRCCPAGQQNPASD